MVNEINEVQKGRTGHRSGCEEFESQGLQQDAEVGGGERVDRQDVMRWCGKEVEGGDEEETGRFVGE